MIRITQHDGDERHQASAAQPRGADTTVYTLPIRAMSRREYLNLDDSARKHIQAQVTERSISLRVDWDGNASSLGRFEVQVNSGAWKACELIDTGNLNDVISPSREVLGDVFLARFQRGPAHRLSVFAVKTIPIRWIAGMDRKEPVSVAERGKDYFYADGLAPQALPWTYSVLSAGIQQLNIELSTGQDYEVWVRLQHPADRNRWRELDPIIRTGSGGSNSY